MPGGDEPGKREELVKRNTRQLYLMFFVFAIIIAAYSCRLLAWFDIGGNYPSYVRAALYLLLFVLWGYSLDQRIIQKPVLHCLRLMDVLMLIWLTLRTLKYEVVTDLTVARYLWYLYYLPILFIPLLGAYTAIFLGKSEDYQLSRKSWLLSLIPTALFLAVITNDFHQQVFSFASGFVENKKLAEDEEHLQRLSENVEKIAREKELLTAKSAMHDNLAASIIVMKQYLSGDFGGIDVETVLWEWEKNIVFREAEHLSEKEKLFASARSSGVLVQIEGKEPPGKAAEMMYAAMQVCLNNALQYARATELEANVFENETSYTVMIYNNGQPPEREIREGGGLTNLRHRIETEGGRMLVQSFPEFSLVIEIPKI